jgi:hypothetical protein
MSWMEAVELGGWLVVRVICRPDDSESGVGLGEPNRTEPMQWMEIPPRSTNHSTPSRLPPPDPGPEHPPSMSVLRPPRGGPAHSLRGFQPASLAIRPLPTP